MSAYSAPSSCVLAAGSGAVSPRQAFDVAYLEREALLFVILSDIGLLPDLKNWTACLQGVRLPGMRLPPRAGGLLPVEFRMGAKLDVPP